MHKRIIITACMVLLLFAGRKLHAQQQMKQYYFSNYNTRNGLLSNRVYSIVQDDKGFLWIGTINGLQRFDGHRFVDFRHDPKNPHSIPDNEVLQVYIDKQKNLWLLMARGHAGIFNTTTFRFTEVKAPVPNTRAFKQLFEDSKGNILLLYPRIALYTLNKKTNSFSAEENFIPTPPKGWPITGIAEQPEAGKYWLATDSGLMVYNSHTKHLNYRNHNPDKEPVIERYTEQMDIGIYPIDSKGRLWFQTWTRDGAPSFYSYDLKNDQPLLHKFPIGPVMGGYCEPKQMLELKNGQLILTGSPILAEYSEELRSFVRIQDTRKETQGEEYQHVLQSYMDREENVWMCTRNEGLYKFNPKAQIFTSISHVNPHSGKLGMSAVLTFVQCADGTVLSSPWGEGLWRYDSNMNVIPLRIKGIPDVNGYTVWSMHRRRDGKIWMGLQMDGGNILIYDEAKGSAERYKVFDRITVRQIVEDHNGNMWIGTQRAGVHKWTAANAKPGVADGFSRLESIPSGLVSKLYVDSSGYLWVSTEAFGVYKINTTTGAVLEHFTDKTSPSIMHTASSGLLQYNDSLMLIAASGLNIFNTKSRTMRYVTSGTILPSPYISSMEKDSSGNLWLGMLKGVCRLNLEKGTSIVFDRDDGMANDNFTVASSYKLRDNRLLFGTNMDFLVFNPSHITSSPVPPSVSFTEFRLSNQSLPLDSLLKLDAIDLRYDNNSIVIDFASITNLQPNKIRYYYKMEGVDKDWVKADHIPRATYPYLAPGKYTFKVRAENTENVAGDTITQLKIHVSPPFWGTWWFYSLLAVITALILFWLDKERLKRKEAIHKVRSDIAGNLHDEINTALNNINILSEMAKIKADREPQKSKEFIEQIHSRSHNMITAMDDMLWSIDPANDSMEKTVLRMKEYIEALGNPNGSKIEVVIDEKVNALNVGMKFRHESFILFKESIRDLLKAGASNYKIHVGVNKSNLVYTIEFKNQGCDMQPLRHLLERQDIQEKLSLLHAKSEVQVHKECSVLEMAIPTSPSNV